MNHQEMPLDQLKAEISKMIFERIDIGNKIAWRRDAGQDRSDLDEEYRKLSADIELFQSELDIRLFRLSEAAPEMYALLEKIMNWVEGDVTFVEPVREIRDLLRKARGEK